MNTKLIREKIKSGEIKSWSDVYGYCTLKEMKETLGRSVKHWRYVKNNPLKLQVQDMIKIIEVFRISKDTFLELVGGGD